MSAQVQHTPGPWTAERVPGGARVTAEDSLPVAWCGNHYSTATGYMPFEANARLIAAAPDMLAALEKVARTLNSPEWQAWENQALTMQLRQFGPAAKGYQGEQFMDDVKAALTKAKGLEQPEPA